ncbi:MAG: hypothetical protein WCL23_01480 [Candidatus Moraniibacteriota bacterium]
MRIYISHPRASDFENELYAPIREHFSESGHEFILPHEHGNDEETKSVIPTCDLLIAEVSKPATGVGIELGRAEAAGIPIECICHTGNIPSSSLDRLVDEIHEYDSKESMLTLFKTIIEKHDLNCN